MILTAYEFNESNGISIYTKNSDLPYDYISVLIDRGYANSPDMHSQIVKLFETSLQGSFQSFSSRVYPDYTMMEFYAERGGAETFLSGMRRFLNGSSEIRQGDYSGYDIFDIAVMERCGLEPEVFAGAEKLKASSLYSKMAIFIQSSSDRSDIMEYAKYLPGPSGSKGTTAGNKAFGVFREKMLEDTITIYDIEGIKDFDFPYYYMLLYYMNTGSPRADIRWLGENGMLIVSGSLPDKADESVFNRAVDDLKQDITVSAGSMSAFASVYGRTVLYGNAKIIKGLEERASKIKFGRFCDFLSGLNPAFSIVPSLKNIYEQKSQIKRVPNGMTLIYTFSEEPKTEISILAGGIRDNEEYYSKPFASEVVLDEFRGYLKNWRQTESSLFSDIRIYSTYCSEGRIEERLKEFFDAVMNWDIRHYRQFSFYDSIFLKGIGDEPPSAMLKTTGESWRQSYSDGYKMLTDGEYRLLFKHLFSATNLIVSIRTDRSIEEIEALAPSLTVYQMPALNSESSKKKLNGCINLRSIPDAAQFSAAYLASPGEYLIDADNVCRISGFRRGEEQSAFLNLTKNLSVKNGITVITALSYRLTGNPDYLINAAVNYR